MRELQDSGIECIGNVPSNWEVKRAKYVADAISKGNGITKEQVLDDGDVGCVRYGEIYSKYNYCFDTTFSRTNSQTIASPKYISYGDILFAGTGELVEEIGKNIVYLGSEACLAGGDIIVMSHSQNPIFLNYALGCVSSQKQKSEDKAKLKVVHISGRDIGNIRIAVPPICEQKRIADFLDSKCAEIDTLSADIQSEIEILEDYKQSIITEAVTKGLDKNASMKDSGIPWIGQVPEHWSIYRIADLYEDRNERGNEDLPLLSVSINSGVSDRELSEEEQDRVFLRSEDKTKYKRVYPGDITYNMMRAWQGAFGAVRVEGMVSPAYVVAKPTGVAKIDSRFIEALLRSPMGIEEMNRYSYGIMDFRKRLYWPQFRIMKVCLPDIEEQKRISDYIDQKSGEINEIISQKRAQLSILADYKKSLIYEYVTGKKEVPQV